MATALRGQTWIYRWAYEPATWAALLRQCEFDAIAARVELAPNPDNVGTLIVEGRRCRDLRD